MTRLLQRGLSAATVTCGLLIASQAMAGGSGMPWEGPLQQIVESITGPVVQAAAVVAVVLFGAGVAMSENGSSMRRGLVVGPTGSGKSALLAFLALQWFRYPQARVVVFDKGRSARAATLAAGGRWHPLQPGGDFTLQPLARIEDDGERAWASEWLTDAVRLVGLDPTPRLREEIWAALGALAQAPVAQRTLTVFTALVQDRAVAAALEPLTLKGPHGALIDGVAPQDETLAAFECFELESLMATPSAVAPVLAALFHEIERGFDGRPTLLILDEAWLFLGETAFAARIREWLKTLRKKGVAVVFATQSLDDVVRSSIAAALIESCPTQIFLPNPRALEPSSADLYRMFGLNRRQLELIAWATPKRTYYWRQPDGRRLFDLKLTGAGLALCGASSPADQTLIESVLAALDPADLRPDRFAREFLKAKGVQHVDDVFDSFDPPAPAPVRFAAE